MEQHIKNKKGLSLIELILSMAILGMILTAILSFGHMQYKQLYALSDAVELQSILRTGMNTITTTLASAKGLYDHEDNPRYSGDPNDQHIERIIFQMDDGDHMDYYILAFREGKIYYAKTNSQAPATVKAEEVLVSHMDFLAMDYNQTTQLVDIKIQGTIADTTKSLYNQVQLRNAEE